MTNITATLDGANVTIVDVRPDGLSVYITFIDSSDNLKVTRKEIRSMADDLATVLATGCTVV